MGISLKSIRFELKETNKLYYLRQERVFLANQVIKLKKCLKKYSLEQ